MLVYNDTMDFCFTLQALKKMLNIESTLKQAAMQSNSIQNESLASTACDMIPHVDGEAWLFLWNN